MNVHTEQKFTISRKERKHYFLNLRHIQHNDVLHTKCFHTMHLQWFAAEDEGRSYDPTEQKIRKAREEGRVAKTQEIPSALVQLGTVALLWIFGTYFLTSLTTMFKRYFIRINSLATLGFENELGQFLYSVFRVMWPTLLVTFVLAIVGNVVQFGWVPSVKPLAPNFSKIAFRFDKWFEKIISIQGWYNIGTSLIKLLLIAGLVAINIYISRDIIAGIVYKPFVNGIQFTIQICFSLLLQSGFVLLLFAIVDYAFQRYQYLEQLKMSFQELKEEYKEYEMDPEVKRRITSRMQELKSKSLPSDIADSDVVVTNPTHFAVALKYDRKAMDVPVVTAKGEDHIALRIRTLAKRSDVPVIENKKLARALYADLEVGDEIPTKYFKAVVLIFQEVYRMKGIQIYE